jgi:hypothetical protein
MAMRSFAGVKASFWGTVVFVSMAAQVQLRSFPCSRAARLPAYIPCLGNGSGTLVAKTAMVTLAEGAQIRYII